jgi:hypothetical protein
MVPSRHLNNMNREDKVPHTLPFEYTILRLLAQITPIDELGRQNDFTDHDSQRSCMHGLKSPETVPPSCLLPPIYILVIHPSTTYFVAPPPSNHRSE